MRLKLFPDEKRPLIFAHRGLSSEEPENTMAAFRAAKNACVPGIELDVHLTRDGKLAVMHDDTTSRLAREAAGANTAYTLEASDWAQLCTLDIGSWKRPDRAGERIPLLQEVFEELGNSVYYDIELKTRSLSGNALETAVCTAIRDARLIERCAVSSFNPFAIARFKKIEPRIPTAIIWCRSKEVYPFLWHGEGRWLGCADYLKPEQVLVRAAPSAAHATFRRSIGLSAPHEIVAWTVDTADEAARLVAQGCAGIISNAPHTLMRALFATEFRAQPAPEEDAGQCQTRGPIFL